MTDTTPQAQPVTLLPCPFCGGAAKIIVLAPHNDTYVQCCECKIMQPSVYALVYSDADAVEVWNRRAESTALATAAQREQELTALVAALADEAQGLRQVIAYIDKHAPRANSSCIKPGITLSEAARAQMRKDGDDDE